MTTTASSKYIEEFRQRFFWFTIFILATRVRNTFKQLKGPCGLLGIKIWIKNTPVFIILLSIVWQGLTIGISLRITILGILITDFFSYKFDIFCYNIYRRIRKDVLFGSLLFFMYGNGSSATG